VGIAEGSAEGMGRNSLLNLLKSMSLLLQPRKSCKKQAAGQTDMVQKVFVKFALKILCS